MRPAFSSSRQALAFLLLVSLLLAAPWLAGQRWLPPREQAYKIEGQGNGPYPWLWRQIFVETNDIDLAFMGSSRVMWGINTPYVQQKLSAQLGRPAVVRTICWGGAGFDNLYFVAKDLLAHRRVKTLVFYDETFVPNHNLEIPRLFRYGDEPGLLSPLPPHDRAIYYLAAVLGLPVNLIQNLFPTRSEDPAYGNNNFYIRVYHANPETDLGCVGAKIGFTAPPDCSLFVPFNPHPDFTPAALTYSALTRSNFTILNRPLPVWQSYFGRKFVALAQSHGCQLVLIRVPALYEQNEPQVSESEFWPDYFHAPITLIGIPPARLFAGLTPGQMEKLYFEQMHFTQNGQNYFTRVLTPALIQAYENRPAQ